MRRFAAIACALLLAAASALALRLWLNSRIPPLDSLRVVQGCVLQSARPCTGAKIQTFTLTLLVGERYESFVLSCDERLRTAAGGGTQVVLGLHAEDSGPSRWTAWRAAVDGREVIRYAATRPWSFFELGSFVVFAAVYLLLALGVLAELGRSRRGARKPR